jgi:hypothetical protein
MAIADSADMTLPLVFAYASFEVSRDNRGLDRIANGHFPDPISSHSKPTPDRSILILANLANGRPVLV